MVSSGLASAGSVGLRFQLGVWALEAGPCAQWVVMRTSSASLVDVRRDELASVLGSSAVLGPSAPGLELTLVWSPWVARGAHDGADSEG